MEKLKREARCLNQGECEAIVGRRWSEEKHGFFLEGCHDVVALGREGCELTKATFLASLKK